MKLIVSSKSELKINKKTIAGTLQTLKEQYCIRLTQVQLLAILREDLPLAIEVADSRNGDLDTSVREMLVVRVGYKYAGHEWPTYSESKTKEAKQFYNKLKSKGVLLKKADMD